MLEEERKLYSNIQVLYQILINQLCTYLKLIIPDPDTFYPINCTVKAKNGYSYFIKTLKVIDSDVLFMTGNGCFGKVSEDLEIEALLGLVNNIYHSRVLKDEESFNIYSDVYV